MKKLFSILALLIAFATISTAQVHPVTATKGIISNATSQGVKQVLDSAKSTASGLASSLASSAKTAGTAIANASDTVGSEVKTGIHTVDTSSNFKLIVNNVTNGISALSTGLKVGAEHVYKVLVVQQIVKAITSIIVYLVLIVVIFLYLRRISRTGETFNNKDHKNYNNTWDDHPEVIIPGVAISVIAGVIFVIYFARTIQETVGGLVNPEYGALQEIFIFVKNATGH